MGKYPCQSTGDDTNHASIFKKEMAEFGGGGENPTNDGKVGRSLADELYGQPTDGQPHGRYTQLRPARNRPL